MLVKKILSLLPNKIESKIKFLYHIGYWPNYKNPRTFNEKLNWRKFYFRDERYAICSDKLLVRSFVSKVLGEKYLIPLVYQGDSITADCIDELGTGIVIKATHNSGGVVLVKPGDDIDSKEISEKMNLILHCDYGDVHSEWWYSEITPKIIVEKLLMDCHGGIPEDYKIHVFSLNGEQTGIVQVDVGRHDEHVRGFYTEDFELLDYTKGGVKQPALKLCAPDTLKEMIVVSKKLAADFNYARVDLYSVAGKVYFGEITFAPQAGYGKFSEKAVDLEWGAYFD